MCSPERRGEKFLLLSGKEISNESSKRNVGDSGPAHADLKPISASMFQGACH